MAGLVEEERGKCGMVFISRNGERFDKCEIVEFEDEEKFRRILSRLIEEDR